MSEELKAALARIACLEGEIAKRDEELAACRIAVENCEVFRARIAELEDLVLSLQCKAIESDDLRAELSALKAQEPVIDAPYGGILRIEAGNLPDSWVRINPCKLYAAPVSEAKAQGVVMPERKTAADFSNYHDESWRVELAEVSNLLLDEVARLNAAPVQQPKCKTCNDNGRIGGPSFYAPDEGGEPCPDCSATVQQVSVPECYARLLKHAFGMTFGEDWNRGTAAETHRNKLIEAVFDCRYLLAAAPAAPAADAGVNDHD